MLQGYVHAADFVPTGRASRRDDVALGAGSRWGCLSLYEASPRAIKQHLQFTKRLQEEQAARLELEEEKKRLRRAIVAAEQRAQFARQRTEQAAKYSKAGVVTRPAYDSLANTARSDAFPSSEADGAMCALYETADLTRHLSSSSAASDQLMGSLRLSRPVSPPFQLTQRLAEEKSMLVKSSAHRVLTARKRAEEQRVQRVIDRELKELDQFEYQLKSKKITVADYGSETTSVVD